MVLIPLMVTNVRCSLFLTVPPFSGVYSSAAVEFTGLGLVVHISAYKYWKCDLSQDKTNLCRVKQVHVAFSVRRASLQFAKKRKKSVFVWDGAATQMEWSGQKLSPVYEPLWREFCSCSLILIHINFTSVSFITWSSQISHVIISNSHDSWSVRPQNFLSRTFCR